ncbi:hypothetical protein [uncultured Xylophilus sp.]|uniref:hypothetical protein n=1 Tax=uncultured Xylophilus sp. TaxID=296832 RepID=UPI0025D3B08E|nr:hypothetical protein [uncultured Xylophilus sp.]
MKHTAANLSHTPRGLGELRVDFEAVDSQLDALCELLRLATIGSKVEASSMHALLQPLRNRLAQACDGLADVQD